MCSLINSTFLDWYIGTRQWNGNYGTHPFPNNPSLSASKNKKKSPP